MADHLWLDHLWLDHLWLTTCGWLFVRFQGWVRGCRRPVVVRYHGFSVHCAPGVTNTVRGK